MTRLKQGYWKAVIWIAFRMLEAAGAKPRTPRKVFDFFAPFGSVDELRSELFSGFRRLALSGRRPKAPPKSHAIAP